MEEIKEDLSKLERRQLKRQQKKEGKEKQYKQAKMKRMLKTISFVLAGVALIGGAVLFFTSQSYLPPTAMHPHIEESPDSHIVTEPIPEDIQRHMLEHADGGNDPGVIIQYNCDDYDCESDLIDKLTSLAERYSSNVYLGPNKYDAKIVLTKLGRREVLKEFDEEKIKNFIE